jgi:RNA 2',3'-cyclic 3'-phosphodiesterase
MSELPQRIRTFIAVNLPADVLTRIGQVQSELKLAARSGAVRWAAPEQIHLTLKFLGDIASASLPELEAALRRACVGIGPFELRAEGLGGFPDLRRPRVLWAGIAGDLSSLHALQENVVRETEAWGKPEERVFHAHLTLGRIKDYNPRGLRELAARIESMPAPQLGCWQVTELHLMRSELSPDGSCYTCLAEISLSGAAPPE